MSGVALGRYRTSRGVLSSNFGRKIMIVLTVEARGICYKIIAENETMNETHRLVLIKRPTDC